MLYSNVFLTISTVYLSIASASSFASNLTTSYSSVPPCQALLSSSLANRVLFPTAVEYEDRIKSFWSYNSRLHPWCLVQPTTAEEVSLTLKTLTDLGEYNHGAGDWYIALRSGGHSLAASNNIDNGVTIDLGLMEGAAYDLKTGLASVGPGGKWMDVYRTLLEDHKVSVVGGRDGDVGVGGFTTGGGISYYTPRLGFACDNVAAMEVVLANGSIITASNDQNTDLYLALKGGSLNAGIVTRFDLEAFPAQNLSYGTQIISMKHSTEFAKAVVDFIDHQPENDALVPTWTRMPTTGSETVVLAIKVNTAGNKNTTAFANIDKIPAIEDTGMISMSLADAAAGSQISAGYRTFWRVLAFANNVDILNKCVELHEVFINKLLTFLSAADFNSIMIPQPFPQKYLQASTAKGKNILGLEESMANGKNGILWTPGVQLNPNRTSEADFAKAQTLVNEWAAGVEEYAKQVGGLVPYVALNYADASQNPLASYGKENVKFLRGVAEKYDPTGFFQYRVPGGFKISRVV